MKNKKIIIILLSTFLIVDSILLILTMNRKNIDVIKEGEIPVTEEKENEEIITKELKYEFNKKVYLKDIIDTDSEEKLDTTELGTHELTVKDKNNIEYKLKYTIVDTKKPMIMGSTTKTTTVGKKINLVNKYLCGDNHDDKPNCYIEGEYDINKVGTYNLVYVAVDSSGNKNTKKIKLKVKEDKPSSSSSSTSKPKKKTPIKTYIEKYKKANTKIGIDVSAWQDNINWKKAKKAGVEFAMLRIGYGPVSGNEIKMDKQFKNNLKGAKEAKVPIGLYFYSYAKTVEEAEAQAKWIVRQLDGQKLDLPIAFDWENWSTFNKYNVSFKKLSDIAQTFIDTVEKYGYKGMLYSSAYYLNNIWDDFENTWVAYYTSNNDFKKPYIMWQLSSSGSVDGISGSVDMDILYENKNEH